jgi:hypothetical protein
MNDKFKRISKIGVVAYFMVILEHPYGGTGIITKNLS